MLPIILVEVVLQSSWVAMDPSNDQTMLNQLVIFYQHCVTTHEIPENESHVDLQ